MIRPAAALAALATVAALAACEPTTSTTPAGATSEGGVPLGPYFLVGLGKEAVPERNITLTLAPGAISGSGPCNSYTGTNAKALPGVQITQMNWTDLRCGESRREAQYFQALTRVQSAEFSGGLLLLKAPDIWLTYEAGTVPGKE